MLKSLVVGNSWSFFVQYSYNFCRTPRPDQAMSPVAMAAKHNLIMVPCIHDTKHNLRRQRADGGGGLAFLVQIYKFMPIYVPNTQIPFFWEGEGSAGPSTPPSPMIPNVLFWRCSELKIQKYSVLNGLIFCCGFLNYFNMCPMDSF